MPAQECGNLQDVCNLCDGLCLACIMKICDDGQAISVLHLLQHPASIYRLPGLMQLSLSKTNIIPGGNHAILGWFIIGNIHAGLKVGTGMKGTLATD